MKKILFTLLIIFLSLSPSFAQNRGITIKLNKKEAPIPLYKKSYALVIGMSDYNKEWNDLPGVEKDIKEVKKALEKHNFEVTVKKNLTKVELDKAFSEFIKNYGGEKDNRLLFYFAGHGYTLNTSYGDSLGYIVPVDAPNPEIDKSGFQSKAMEMSQIEIYAKRIQSKHALFLFDACFAGSLFAMRDAVPASINYKTIQPVRQFITSGSEDESVPDKSIFREEFVTALTTDEADTNQDGYLTGTELGTFLQENVINYSYDTQHPQYGKIRNKRLNKGDFVFVLANNNNINSSQEQKTGSIKLITEYSGKFYIDYDFKRQVEKFGTYVFDNIPGGIRILSIKNSNGKNVWLSKIFVASGHTSTIKAEQIIEYGSLSLTSDNVEGDVYIDDIQYQYISKETTIRADQLTPGEHTVQIKSNGKILWSKEFYITANKTKNLSAHTDVPSLSPILQRLVDNMVYVKGGTFTMGCTSEQGSDCEDDEKPPHRVTLDSYSIGKYEVTQEEWREVMGNNPSYHKNCDKCPVEDVNWNEIQDFIKKLNQMTYKHFRLPTEAEWEYAARGGNHSKGYKYSGSNDIGNVAWYDGNSGKKTHPVGSKSPNELGLYDMSGNVWEWCSDLYEGYPGSSGVIAITGPGSRVDRGGSWSSSARGCRVAYRISDGPVYRSDDVGFRLAHSL